VIYRCPECLFELSNKSERFVCINCKKVYPIIEGIPLLCRKPDFYYGEIKQAVMEEVINNTLRNNWQKAVSDYCDQVGSKFFREYVLSHLRSGFKFLLNHFQNGIVLDYGCGLGAITSNLARNFAMVYAADLTFERARFTQLRAKQEQLRNVEVFCCGDSPHIPLSDNSVNVIILDGILEWLPEYKSGNPYVIQREFLEEMRRILKDDGLVFIGIENRFGYGYLMGDKDDHSNLRFSSILPRGLANFYSLIARRKPYRTYTHSNRGYKKLLKSAGFLNIDIYGLMPNYRLIEKVVRLEDKNMVTQSLKNGIVRKELRNRLVGPFFGSIARAYGILASSSAKTIKPFFIQLADHISKTYFGGTRCSIDRYLVMLQTPTVHLYLSHAEGRYIVKLPLDSRTEERMDRSISNINQIFERSKSSECLDLISRPIAWGDYLGQRYLIEPLMFGISLEKIEVRKRLNRYLPGLCEFLVSLCKNTSKEVGIWRHFLTDQANRYGMKMASAYEERGITWISFHNKLLRITDWIATQGDNSAAFTCALHGDFWHGNILADPDGVGIISVLDWDRLEFESLPFLDLFHLLSYHYTFIQKINWKTSVVKIYEDIVSKTGSADVVQTYARGINVDDKMETAFLMLYWLKQSIYLLSSTPPFPGEKLTRYVFELLDYFYEICNKRARVH
jgi:ubiquinone/menaquinone biosynthesis C-methylase UbiE